MTPCNSSGHGRSVLLLNSSHGRFTTGSTPWVRATIAALDALNPAHDILITSVGLPGWELVAYQGAQMGYRQKLILPGHDNAAGERYFGRCQYNLELDSQLTEPVFTGTGGAKQFRTARDAMAFELADTVCPVSLRSGGRLDSLLKKFVARGGQTGEQYREQYTGKNWMPRYELNISSCNPELQTIETGWLIHWTHSYPGPWPGETSANFYHDMLAEPDTYVRSAGSTLARILTEGVIRASSTHMSSSVMTVSLTSLPPLEALANMRWRSRWRRWNMEPFGIAMRKEALVPLGARQVRYYDQLPPDLPEEEKIFSQRRGKQTDWSDEQEWRIHGDIHLDDLQPHNIILLVYGGFGRKGWPMQERFQKIVDITAQNS